MDREIILLRGIEELSTKSVAMLLELSPDAVYKRYRRALQKLRARLPGSVFDEIEA